MDASDEERAQAHAAIVDAEFADTAAPAAGAEVWFWPPRTAAERSRDGRLQYELDDLESALRRHGRMVRADAHGRASIEADPQSEVVVRAGDHYGELELAGVGSTRPLPEHVLLFRDRALRVLVVDTRGKPHSGVDVDTAIEGNVTTIGTTDAQGLIAWRHLQQRVRIPAASDPDWSIVLRCAGQHLLGTARAVRASEVFVEEPIRLVLPEGGDIELDLVDQHGEEIRGDATLGDDAADLYCTTDRNTNPRLYAGVPLGHTFVVTGRSGVLGSVVGPTVAGELVRARLEVVRARWKFTGRIARADSATLRNGRATLQAEFHCGDRSCAELAETGWLGDDGRFECRFERTGASGDLANLRVQIDEQSLPVPHVRQLAGRFAPGVHDLGELLVPVPLGEQLLVSVEVRHGGQSLLEQAGLGIVIREHEGRQAALPVRIERREGRALLFGVPSTRPMELHCNRPGYVPAVAAFERGAHVVVALEAAARLWVTTVLPPIPEHFLQFVLTPSDDPQGHDYYASGERGRHVWPQLRPGRYRLRVHALGRTLIEVPAVDLAAGDNVWPHDGSRVDLRGRVAAVRIEVRSAHDEKILDDAGILAVDSGTTSLQEDWDANPTSSGWLALPGQPIDVLIRCEGFVPKRLPHVKTDAVVRLQRRTGLELVPPPGEAVDVLVHVETDGVTDPMLRAFDVIHDHRDDRWSSMNEPFAITQPPGTVLQLSIVRGEVAGPAQRIVVGPTSPQQVLLR